MAQAQPCQHHLGSVFWWLPFPAHTHTHREPGKAGLLTWKTGMQVRLCDICSSAQGH